MKEEHLKKLKGIFPKERIIVNSADIRNESQNTLGIERNISAIVRPKDICEVQNLVQFANDTNSPLYPISRGMNIGYGDKLPVTDNNILVELHQMHRISNFDNELGIIDICPGVTQEDLFDFLKDHDSKFIMDVTGAGTKSSIIGNILEGGFRHTPKGNYIEKIKEVQVVLGNGNTVTINKEGVGPDLRYMVIQSNFGIVTKMRIELMKAPEHYSSFLVKVKEQSGLEPLVEALSDLRMEGTIISQVHISNSVRSYITTQKCPEEYRERVLTSEDVVELTKKDLVKLNPWSAFGGLYGSKAAVKVKKREMKRALRGVGKVIFMDDRKIEMVGRLAKSKIASLFGKSKDLQKAHQTLDYINGLGKGIPSNEALDNIQWRTENYDDMGLIWYGPVFPAKGKTAKLVEGLAVSEFKKYGFEMPITLTLVKPDTLVGILSISFDKMDHNQQERAFSLYKSLDAKLISKGIFPYRASILAQENMPYEPDFKKLIRSLKKECDPNHIISPGRYGIE